MITFVSPEWVENVLSQPGYVIIDPRGPIAYLRGHLKGAINLPLRKLLDLDGRLLPEKDLASVMGAIGVGDQTTPVVYDSFDGQRASMAAWILEYLGRGDVHFMDLFLTDWVSQGREIFYRPVTPKPEDFTLRTGPNIRATIQQLNRPSSAKLLDLRSPEEYSGTVEAEGRQGHIPGAVNLVWRDLVGGNGRFLCDDDAVHKMMRDRNISMEDEVISYCRSGIRAALGYVVLNRLGYNVRLYDGSFQDWESAGMPVESHL